MLENKILKVCLSNDHVLKINLYKNPVAEYIHHCAKHLQHVPLNFYEYDIFFDSSYENFDTALEKLIEYANQVKVKIDPTKITSQYYLNHLHEVYEKRFDGNPNWLKYHELIHIAERIISKLPAEPIISINYRTLAGQLQKPFTREYYQHATVQVKKNQCFVRWQELAKTPYAYYENKEPDDITRLCELAKPWITLRPSFHIACEDIDFTHGSNVKEFDKWFSKHQQQWCRHWGITDWDPYEIFKVIPIGLIEDADVLVANIRNKNLPIKVIQ